MFLLSFNLFFSQVGINTPDPKASLDISAKTTDGSQPEGIIAPRLTEIRLKQAMPAMGQIRKEHLSMQYQLLRYQVQKRKPNGIRRKS